MRIRAKGRLIVPSVKVRQESNHYSFSGERSGDPHRQQASLGTRAGKSYFLSARNQLRDQLRPFHFKFVRGSQMVPLESCRVTASTMTGWL